MSFLQFQIESNIDSDINDELSTLFQQKTENYIEKLRKSFVAQNKINCKNFIVCIQITWNMSQQRVHC